MDFSELLAYLNKKPPAEERKVDDAGADETRKSMHLDATRVLESQGQEDPLNTIHPLGVGKTEHAFGAYGLMPDTLREFAKRLYTKNGPNLPITSKMSEKEIQDRLADNEDVQRAYAKNVLTHIMNENPEADDEDVQWMYKSGHNYHVDELPESKLRDIENNERTKRFRALKGLLDAGADIKDVKMRRLSSK